MKKILAILLGVCLFVGCQNTPSNTTVKKTCSISQSGLDYVIEAQAQSEDANVDMVSLRVESTYEAMGVSADMISDELKEELGKQMESAILLSAGLSEYEEYVEVTKSEFNDTGFIFALDMDTKAIIENGAAGGEDLGLKSFTEAMSSSGFTCN